MNIFNIFNRVLLFLTFSAFALLCEAQTPIFIDENFDDWQGKMQYNDATADQLSGRIGIQNVQVYNDNQYLFLKIELSQEIKIQENNSLSLYIDTDMNPNTGYKIKGIGAEIGYNFGERSAYYNLPTQSIRIYHDDLGLACLPSVSSQRFELMMQRSISINNVVRTMGENIKMVWIDNQANGDAIPDNNNNGLSYAMAINGATQVKPILLNKKKPEHIRFMTNNCLQDDLFNQTSGAAQKRILQAINPDVIAFQELYNATSSDVVTLLNTILPQTPSQAWKASKINPDIILASKYPILGSQALNGNGIFKIMVGNKSVILVNAHLPCCENDTDRQSEVDLIVSAVRKAKNNSGLNFSVETGSPIMIMGDMNFVGWNQQVKSFVQGDIVNEGSYGPDVRPDWDNSDMEDARPYVLNVPAAYSWYSAGNSFMPGRLDYIFYTGSVMKLENSFVFKTEGLGQNELVDLNLNFNDSSVATDHLPVVGDFDLNPQMTQPLQANVTIIQSNLCPGDSTGQIKATAQGGSPPYLFSLDGFQFSPDSFFYNLTPGVYTLSVKDASDEISQASSITIFDPPAISVIVFLDSLNLIVSAQGGTGPLSYSLDGVSYSSSNNFPIDKNGSITVYIKDSNNCITTVEYSIIIDLDDDSFNSDADCDDTNPLINPLAVEIPDNGIDEDCSGGDLMTSVHYVQNQITYYPNPTSSTITVLLPSGYYELSVANAMDKVILQKRILLEDGLNVECLPPGFYVLTLKNSASGKRYLLKIMKT